MARAEGRAQRALDGPQPREPQEVTSDAPWFGDELREARERLQVTREFASYEYQRRDISGAGTSFLPASGVPGYIASDFATAARSRAPLAEALQHKPHPGSLKVSAPRLVNGAAMNVQAAENQAVAEQDPTYALAEVPTATIAGQLDLSRQLYDFSMPGADQWVAAELGAAYAATLEQQLISGSGASGQLLGLRIV